MFSIDTSEDGIVRLSGILDSSQAETAGSVFRSVTKSCVIDFRDLEYISSAGLGILLATYKRLSSSGQTIKIVNAKEAVKNILLLARFDILLEIE